MTGQTKIHSLFESFTNIIVGFGVAIISQLLIFPLYGIDIPLSSNLQITVWFTFISIIRSYILRRIYNRKMLRHYQEIKRQSNA
jgi:hypothetical protein